MASDLIIDTDRLHMAIGKVVVQFQFVEYVVAEELASLLHMRDKTDKERVSAAMSYRQKVDLLCDLYPTHRNPAWPVVDIPTTRKALLVAEEFRNAVVHSFWHVGGSGQRKWMRTKATLRTSAGLQITMGKANIECIENCARAIYTVRDWYLGQTEEIKRAIKTLKSGIRSLSLPE